MEQPPHVVMLPVLAMGHLIPLCEFAKRLVLTHNFSVTFIVPNDGPLSTAPKLFLDSLIPIGINYVLLPSVNVDELSNNVVSVGSRISLAVSHSLPSLRDVLKSLVSSSHVVTLVVDLMATDAFDVAAEFNISPYVFFASTAMLLSFILDMPKLDESVSCEQIDLLEPVKIPGVTPVHGKYILLDLVRDRKSDSYKRLLHYGKRYRLAEGIMVNSFKELEGGDVEALQEKEPSKPPVYPIGPLVRMGGVDNGSDCLRWLDDQPYGSVLFVSFGSFGTVSFDQLTELAFGLEMSEQRFLWVVRSPNDKVAVIPVDDQNDPSAFLPEGFLDRIKRFGVVVPSWAPQAQILSHGSTGGFLTHCGWNSTLESIGNGVPLITWPLHTEQKMNASILNDNLNVALRLKVGKNGIIGRAEITEVVKGLMEGEEGNVVRSRMRDMKDVAMKVLSKDGESTKSLAELAQKWKNKIMN